MQLFSATIARGRALGEYIRRHRAKSVVFLTLSVVGLFILAHAAQAAGSAPPVTEQAGFFNQMLALISQIILALARICMSLTLFALTFFIQLAKYNNFIDAPPVIIGWVMVRDLANMFFIVVLLVIAFGTILGLDQYEWKKALAKLVMAAVLLNFSKLIAQLIIDVAHVFTMTFLNALSATAGGNLINMFHMQGLLSLLAADPARLSSSDLRLDIFAASVLALVFASMAMLAMGAYVVVMLLRVVVLWVLIIIAPFAYLLGIIPTTEGYASEYWSKFMKHVIAAPVMVFFLWLSFATIGSGNIGNQIGLDLKGNGNVLQGAGSNPSTSLLEVSTWENMGSFMIAIIFMAMGIKMVQQLGVEGAGLTDHAIDFAKKVGTYASGAAAARYLAPKIAMKAPLIGGDKWVNAYRTAKGMAGYGLGRVAQIRDKYAIGLEEDHKDAVRKGEVPGVGAYAKKIFAGLVESGGRSAKKAEDWEEAAERQHEIVEKDYSTSSSAGGRLKQDVTARLHETEKKSDAKKQQKVDDRVREITMSAEAFAIATKDRARDEDGNLIDDGKLSGEEKEVYMKEFARIAKERDVDVKPGMIKKFASDAHRDFELSSGTASAQLAGKVASASLEETEKIVEAQRMRAGVAKAKAQKKQSGYEKLTAAHVRTHEQETAIERQESGLKRTYLHGAGHEVERRTIQMVLRIEADKNDMDAAEASMRANLLTTAVGGRLIASQAESDRASTNLSNTRASLLSAAQDAAAAETASLVGNTADNARQQVKTEMPEIAKQKEQLDALKNTIDTLTGEIEKLNRDLDGYETELQNTSLTPEQRSNIEQKVQAKQREVAGKTAELNTRNEEKSALDDQHGSDINKFEMRVAEVTEKALRGIAKNNVQVANAVSDAMKKLKSVLEQKSVGSLNEAVYQKIIGDRQQIPFPEEATRSAIASMMKDLNKMTKEQLIDAFAKRAERIASRTQEERNGGRQYSKADRREDELFTQAIGAKLAQVRNIDDLTSTVEPILAKIGNFAKQDRESLQKLVVNAGSVGRTIGGAGSSGQSAVSILGADTGEARNLRTVLGRVAERRSVTDSNKLEGLIKVSRDPNELERLEQEIARMSTESGNLLGGLRSEEVVRMIRELRDGYQAGRIETRRVLAS